MKNLKKLTREQMKSVFGNGGRCYIKVTLKNGNSEIHAQYFPGNATEQSSGANAACLGALQNTSVSACSYDCAYDGIGKITPSLSMN